jgi:hypothetical protein
LNNNVAAPSEATVGVETAARLLRLLDRASSKRRIRDAPREGTVIDRRARLLSEPRGIRSPPVASIPARPSSQQWSVRGRLRRDAGARSATADDRFARLDLR